MHLVIEYGQCVLLRLDWAWVIIKDLIYTRHTVHKRNMIWVKYATTVCTSLVSTYCSLHTKCEIIGCFEALKFVKYDICVLVTHTIK